MSYANLLKEYARAREVRGKRLIFRFDPFTGEKLYFCGAYNWTPDRDAAVRFTSTPPTGFKSELA